MSVTIHDVTPYQTTSCKHSELSSLFSPARFYESSHLSKKKVTRCIYISVYCICGRILKCVHVCWFIKQENVMGLNSFINYQ